LVVLDCGGINISVLNVSCSVDINAFNISVLANIVAVKLILKTRENVFCTFFVVELMLISKLPTLNQQKRSKMAHMSSNLLG